VVNCLVLEPVASLIGVCSERLVGKV